MFHERVCGHATDKYPFAWCGGLTVYEDLMRTTDSRKMRSPLDCMPVLPELRPVGLSLVFFPGAHSWPSAAHLKACSGPSGPHPLLKFCMVLFCGLSLLSGCAGSTRQNPDDPNLRYLADTEEMMPIPYTPRDDGRPLTQAELHAFKTVSDLDRHLTEEEARIVELHFKNYLHQMRGSFDVYLQRSARFLPYVKQVFASKGIPDDIAYLFMVESGGNPVARSHAGAVGLWQFMPGTGKLYGLRQDRWLDERRDPYKATVAAADYLIKLNRDFCNWHLAVAAYNAGEGKIGRAISGTGASGFFDLCRLDAQLEVRARLKDETRDYVPRLIAMAKIMRNLDRLGFSKPQDFMAWDLAPMPVPPETNLVALADRVGLTWDSFSAMNPAYLRTASPTHETVAYVPPAKRDDAVRWAAAPDARLYAGWKEHVVGKGDSLASLAKQNEVSVSSILTANRISSLPRRGSVIFIPGRRPASVLDGDNPAFDADVVLAASDVADHSPPEHSPVPIAKAAKSGILGGRVDSGVGPRAREKGTPLPVARFYRVQSGDTMYSLAVKWGTDVASIQAANKMGKDNATVKVGERLAIPRNSKNAPLTVSPSRAPAHTADAVTQKKADKAKGRKAVSTPPEPKKAAPAKKGKKTSDSGEGVAPEMVAQVSAQSPVPVVKGATAADSLQKNSKVAPGKIAQAAPPAGKKAKEAPATVAQAKNKAADGKTTAEVNKTLKAGKAPEGKKVSAGERPVVAEAPRVVGGAGVAVRKAQYDQNADDDAYGASGAYSSENDLVLASYVEPEKMPGAYRRGGHTSGSYPAANSGYAGNRGGDYGGAAVPAARASSYVPVEPASFSTSGGRVTSGGYAISEDAFYPPEESGEPMVFRNIYVKKGQSLEDIARLNGVSVQHLREANNFGLNDTVEAGQKILVPQS